MNLKDCHNFSDFRKWIRGFTFSMGTLNSAVKKKAVDEMKTYEMYYDYKEPLNKVKCGSCKEDSYIISSENKICQNTSCGSSL